MFILDSNLDKTSVVSFLLRTVGGNFGQTGILSEMEMCYCDAYLAKKWVLKCRSKTVNDSC